MRNWRNPIEMSTKHPSKTQTPPSRGSKLGYYRTSIACGKSTCRMVMPDARFILTISSALSQEESAVLADL